MFEHFRRTTCLDSSQCKWHSDYTKGGKNSLQDFRNAIKNDPHQCGSVVCSKALQLDSIATKGGEKSIITTNLESKNNAQ